jgi:hypothetical protein
MNDHRPNPAAEVPGLTWTNTHPGRWVTDAPLNGEDGAFEAVALRDDRNGTWEVLAFTYGRSLGTTSDADNLTDARAKAQSIYDVVEGPNR